MIQTSVISHIYESLTTRYKGISVSTIKSVLKGKLKVKTGQVDFQTDKTTSPRLEEAEDAFKKYDCAIFTAFRGGYTLEENLARNAKLKVDMEALGMMFRPVNGCYREADWEYPCVEYCYFVYSDSQQDAFVFFEQVYQLSAKYDQDSFLYKRAGINRTAFLVATTEAGRNDLLGDIKFAGQLHLNVPDVEAWTDCSDGRFAFQLKGMVLINTDDPKLKIGEGDVFDIEGYSPDGIAVLRMEKEHYLKEVCKNFSGGVPLETHVFAKDDYSETYIHDVVYACLKKLCDKKCKQIGFLCSVCINGSRANGAAYVYQTLKQWMTRNAKKVKRIVVVDPYGDYGRVVNKFPRNE